MLVAIHAEQQRFEVERVQVGVGGGVCEPPAFCLQRLDALSVVDRHRLGLVEAMLGARDPVPVGGGAGATRAGNELPDAGRGEAGKVLPVALQVAIPVHVGVSPGVVEKRIGEHAIGDPADMLGVLVEPLMPDAFGQLLGQVAKRMWRVPVGRIVILGQHCAAATAAVATNGLLEGAGGAFRAGLADRARVAEKGKAAARDAATISAAREAWLRLGRTILSVLPVEIPFGDHGGTNPRNNTSVITDIRVTGDRRLVFTGDAGVPALNAAADFLDSSGRADIRPTMFDIPHHGSRRNLDSDTLTRYLGRRPRGQPQPYSADQHREATGRRSPVSIAPCRQRADPARMPSGDNRRG